MGLRGAGVIAVGAREIAGGILGVDVIVVVSVGSVMTDFWKQY
jgi:hypothetical protein